MVIFGMGRVGTGAYDTMERRYGGKVLGIDHDAANVAAHLSAGRRVICGDATDPEFWANIRYTGKVKLVMLAMPRQTANMYALKRIAASDYSGMIAATAKYDDEMEALEAGGAHFVFNFFADAGAGFAEEVQRVMVP